MTITIDKPAEKLSDSYPSKGVTDIEFFKLVANGADTTFLMTKGWRPFTVHAGDALMYEGSGDDYTLEYDGFVLSIVFAVAPPAGNLGILAKRILK